MKDKGEIENVEAWICEYQGLVIVINYEGGGYDEKTIDVESIEDEFDYIPEGC